MSNDPDTMPTLSQQLEQLTSLTAMSSQAIMVGDAPDAAGDAPTPTPAPTPAPDPDSASLFDMLHKDATAPSSTAIAAVPSTGLTPDMIQQLHDVMMLTSFISVTSMRQLRNTIYKGVMPDITTPDGAAQFVKAAANAKNDILTSAMGGYLSLETGSARSFSKSTTSADLHMEFLATLFDGFNFPQSTMKELDSVLTSVKDNIANLKLSWSNESSTLDHMVFFYYFDSVQGLDVKVPKVRLYFLHIDQKSWELSVGKSNVNQFTFNMNFFDSIYDMDTVQTAADRDNIAALLKKFTGQDMDTLEKLLSPKKVSDDRDATPSA